MTIDRALEERIAAAVEGARSRASARLRGKSRFSSASTIFTPKGKISSTKGPSLSVRINFSDKKFEELHRLFRLDFRKVQNIPKRDTFKRAIESSSKVLLNSVKARYRRNAEGGRQWPRIKQKTIDIKRYRKRQGHIPRHIRPKWVLRETDTTLNSLDVEKSRKGLLIGFVRDEKRPPRFRNKDGSPGKPSQFNTTIKLARLLNRRWSIFPNKVQPHVEKKVLGIFQKAFNDYIEDANKYAERQQAFLDIFQ